MEINTVLLREQITNQYRRDIEALDRIEMFSSVRPTLEDVNRSGLVMKAQPIDPIGKPVRINLGNGRTVAAKRKPRGSHNAIEACLKLSEPFGIKDLAAATGLSEKGASSQLYRWFGDGRLLKVSPGQYKRGPKFSPLAAGVEKRPNVPAPDPDLKSLEDQLADALKERDRARGANQETLARIAQHKVDKLQKQIDGARM
jgi:hypothetical protein